MSVTVISVATPPEDKARYDQALEVYRSCRPPGGDPATSKFLNNWDTAFVGRAKRLYPSEHWFAEMVVKHFTQYGRRRYGGRHGTTFCMAEVDVLDPENNRPFTVDAAQSVNYPRAHLMTVLILAKIATPRLAIATRFYHDQPQHWRGSA